jgi:Fe-Mn family superoxide dismutase
MSQETLEYHHGKHHAAYVDKLNGLIEGTEFADMGLEDIILASSGPVFNNAAQAWNHRFFWHCLTPPEAPRPSGRLAEAIERDFGDLQTLRERFNEALTGLFGSGWVWLVRDANGVLSIESLGNAGNPMTDRLTPLLTCDMWEHAYYIDYRNAKAEYFEAFWQLVNWDFVADNYERNEAFRG